MSIDAKIVRIGQRPNGVILYLDAYPGKLGIVAPTHAPEVGQRVRGGEDSVLITAAADGEAGMIASYRRVGLALYERGGEDEQPND